MVRLIAVVLITVSFAPIASAGPIKFTSKFISAVAKEAAEKSKKESKLARLLKDIRMAGLRKDIDAAINADPPRILGPNGRPINAASPAADLAGSLSRQEAKILMEKALDETVSDISKIRHLSRNNLEDRVRQKYWLAAVRRAGESSRSESGFKYSMDVTSGKVNIAYSGELSGYTAEIDAYKAVKKVAEWAATAAAGYSAANVANGK